MLATLVILASSTLGCGLGRNKEESITRDGQVANKEVVDETTAKELTPGRRAFPDFHTAAAAVPGVRLPQWLPPGAELVSAEWIYPPKLTTQQRDGRMEIVGTDYDVNPSLDWGDVVCTFRLPGGKLGIQQGRQPADSVGVNSMAHRQRVNGRLVTTYEVDGRIRVVEWLFDKEYRMIVWSDVLSFENCSRLLIQRHS